jgi:hypothetical protein
MTQARLARLVVASVCAAFFISACDSDERYEPPAVPTFTTWEQLRDFIQERHKRLASFAEDYPSELIQAHVSPVRELDVAEVRRLQQAYEVSVYSVEHSQGQFAVTMSVPLETVGNRGIVQFVVQAAARELLELSKDSLVAIVVADGSIDSITGDRRVDRDYLPPRPITEDYRLLHPTTVPP